MGCFSYSRKQIVYNRRVSGLLRSPCAHIRTPAGPKPDICESASAQWRRPSNKHHYAIYGGGMG
jgi:hypothetical protein